ncbi:type III secretion system export apparatus subunit SctT [Trinickia sp. EG282A]|uniref:type III secretion system export apparatus subunit SctT n=1 Tax=Trinickia sp. EG282A TaxID=3237013 RepID=UPI0034D2DEC8
MSAAAWAQWLSALGFSLLRPLGVVLMVPLFSRATLGGTLTRNALILLIALPLLPLHDAWPAVDTARRAWPTWLATACTEIVIGLVIGFAAAIPFWALDMAGSFIDTMRGATMANVLNPMLGQQSSLLGIVFSHVFSLLFMMTGGLNELVAAIYDSYRTLPPGVTLARDADWLSFFLRDWQLMYELCLRFSMPALVGILLVDMALGLVNRSAQQLNVFFLSMPLKSAFAALLLIMSSGFAFHAFVEYSSTFAHAIRALLSLKR